MRREYAELLPVPVETITKARLREVLEAAAARGARVSGRHGFRYLRTVLRWARATDRIAGDPAAEITAREVTAAVGRERRRERVLSPMEIARLWRVLEQRPHDPYSQVFRVILLTGQRLGEVTGMRWDDVDLDRREWRQPTNKSDRPHVVPLSDAAAAIIARRARGSNSGHVFVSTAGTPLDGRRGNWSRATATFGAAAGVTGWTRHDLRRTFATVLASLRVDRGVIELLLNHAETAGKGGLVASIYNRHGYAAEKLAAVEKLAMHIRRLADGAAAEVIEMRSAVIAG
jgi:integrase